MIVCLALFNMLLNLCTVFLIVIIIFSLSRCYIWFHFKPSGHLYSLFFFCNIFKTFFFKYFQYDLHSLSDNLDICSICGLDSAICFVDIFIHAILFPHVFCGFEGGCIFVFASLETFWEYVEPMFELHFLRECMFLLLLISWLYKPAENQ